MTLPVGAAPPKRKPTPLLVSKQDVAKRSEVNTLGVQLRNTLGTEHACKLVTAIRTMPGQQVVDLLALLRNNPTPPPSEPASKRVCTARGTHMFQRWQDW